MIQILDVLFLERLLQPGVLRKACKGAPEAVVAIVTARDWRKRTVLHLAAGQGNTLLAQLFLEAVGENDRAFFAAALDQGGHVISLHHYTGITYILILPTYGYPMP